MRPIYSLLMYLLTPYFLLRLWWKGRRLPAYRQRISERFCLQQWQPHHLPMDIWVHAVSLGEVIAVTPLIEALLAKNWRILITTMTPSGSARVRQYFAERVHHQYVPYDIPWVLTRFFRKVKPRLALMVETELWPNLVHFAQQAHIPLLLINARLSQLSYQGYKRIRFLIKPLLNQFTAILAQAPEDAERFCALGAKLEKVEVLGNIKFDLQLANNKLEAFSELKERWGKQRPVMIVASTHEDEEYQILSRLKKLQQALPELILLIAPRHPERFQKIYQQSLQLGFKVGLRSQIETINCNNEVVVLDSLGELLGFYQVSDYAFVGGSLVPIGGHNVLEPIAFSVPVLTGPHVHNFKTICGDLQAAQAIELVGSADELIEKTINLHRDQTRRASLVKNASAVLEENKGAINRYLDQIESILSS